MAEDADQTAPLSKLDGLRAIWNAWATAHQYRDKGACVAGTEEIRHIYSDHENPGADDGIRTRDLRFTKPLLYQLSYVGLEKGRRREHAIRAQACNRHDSALQEEEPNGSPRRDIARETRRDRTVAPAPR
jgi:hypothetical protein